MPPPAAAFKKGPDGKQVHPLEFDFDSDAYVHWAANDGQIPNGFLASNVFIPYQKTFPILGGRFGGRRGSGSAVGGVALVSGATAGVLRHKRG